MRLLTTILLAGLLLLPASAFATWNFYDFGTAYFDEHNNSSDIAYPGHGFVPSPGLDDEGGELYDIEGLNFALDNDTMYITLTSTFGYGVNSSYWGQYFASGDLFFGFDGQYDQFALDLSSPTKGATVGLWAVDEWNYITDKPGTYYNNLSIRLGVGAFKVKTGNVLGGAEFMATLYDEFEPNPMYAGEKDTYVWEFKFATSMLGVDVSQYSMISFHNTLECGNDLLEEDFDLGVVPEPSTMILLGLGLCGVGATLRRRK